MFTQLIEKTGDAILNYMTEKNAQLTEQDSNHIAAINGIVAKWQRVKEAGENAEGLFKELSRYVNWMNGLYFRLFPSKDPCRLRYYFKQDVFGYYQRQQQLASRPDFQPFYDRLDEAMSRIRLSDARADEHQRMNLHLQRQLTELNTSLALLQEQHAESEQQLVRYQQQLDQGRQVIAAVHDELTKYKAENERLRAEVHSLSQNLLLKNEENTTLWTQLNQQRRTVAHLQEAVEVQESHLQALIKICQQHQIGIPEHIVGSPPFLSSPPLSADGAASYPLVPVTTVRAGELSRVAGYEQYGFLRAAPPVPVVPGSVSPVTRHYGSFDVAPAQ